MRVILKQQILTDIGNAVLDLPEFIAKAWIETGKAAMASRIETATLEPRENTMKEPAKRRKRGGKHGIKSNNPTGN